MFRRASLAVPLIGLAALSLAGQPAVGALGATAAPPVSKCPSLHPKYEKWGLNCDGWRPVVKNVTSQQIGAATGTPWKFNYAWDATSNLSANGVSKDGDILGKESGVGGPANIGISFYDPDQLNRDWYRYIEVKSVADLQGSRAEVRCGIYLHMYSAINGVFTELPNLGCDVANRLDEQSGKSLPDETKSGRVDPTKPVEVKFREVEDGGFTHDEGWKNQHMN